MEVSFMLDLLAIYRLPGNYTHKNKIHTVWGTYFNRLFSCKILAQVIFSHKLAIFFSRQTPPPHTLNITWVLPHGIHLCPADVLTYLKVVFISWSISRLICKSEGVILSMDNTWGWNRVHEMPSRMCWARVEFSWRVCIILRGISVSVGFFSIFFKNGVDSEDRSESCCVYVCGTALITVYTACLQQLDRRGIPDIRKCMDADGGRLYSHIQLQRDRGSLWSEHANGLKTRWTRADGSVDNTIYR